MRAAAVRAPEIDRPGLVWFNVSEPLSLADLRGKLVILDFWTFCCVNCLHILPTLRRLEQAFPEDVAVIGVHSPKFAAEREPENVRRAIARHGIVHPVVQDPEFLIWQEYAVRAWPTLIFVSPDGYVIGQHSGEPDAERLLEVVGQTVKDYRRKGTMDPRPLDLAPEAVPAAQFCFPGKIKPLSEAPEAPGKLWMLADSGHHQIVLLDDEGRELMRFGSGEAGFANGPSDRARFRDPQGLAADAAAIYVADTGNHAIRRIDRQTGQVTTLAGNGRRGYVLESAVPFGDAELASPWDLALSGGTLYFADSETSAIRAIVSTPEGPVVETLVGKGLFEFGHVNGDYDSARLQHCLGLDWWEEAGPEGGLLVADSYNNALRVVDFASRTLRDLDDGFLCEDSLCLPLAEPAGVAADGSDRLLVSDTNNHRILEYFPAARRYRTWAG